MHNLAVLDRTPHLDQLDNDDDASFAANRTVRRQPRELNRTVPTDTGRDVYAKTWFNRPDTDEEQSDDEEETDDEGDLA